MQNYEPLFMIEEGKFLTVHVLLSVERQFFA